MPPRRQVSEIRIAALIFSLRARVRHAAGAHDLRTRAAFSFDITVASCFASQIQREASH
jgi:hypothetical protein